jgi:hypothetical protein
MRGEKMKTLIIPDVHTKAVIADTLRWKEKPDATVFLGDLWDDWNDGPGEARRVAEWVADLMADPSVTLLVGNHDLPYLFPETRRWSLCSGYTQEKAKAIAEVLPPEAHWRWKLATTVEGWLLTHAGLSARLGVDPAALAGVEKMLHEGVFVHDAPMALGAGYSRGGPQPCGGVLWCDWRDEFRPLAGVKQIMGHTPRRRPEGRWVGQDRPVEVMTNDNYGDGFSINLDTHLRHYALIEEGRVEVKDVDVE